ncbi:MAG: outer membrane lipoprotein chaperone LolA [Rhodocyclales bacterium]|nr:outer membrane lipoprotein chaperone LolA [Rhodocyclales bacterium]
MKRVFSGWVLALWATLAAGVAIAQPGVAEEAVRRLESFVTQTSAAQGRFRQEVLDPQGRAVQRSEGRFVYERPSRFRWEVTAPAQQLVVSDGKTVQVWDADLEQVVVTPLTQALSGSPVAILADAQALHREFAPEGGEVEGERWAVRLRARSAEAGIVRVVVEGEGEQLRRMRIEDHFGQTSEIVFTEFRRMWSVSPEEFAFTPPPGTKVLENRPGRR